MIYKGKKLEEYSGKSNSLFKDLTGKTFNQWFVICRSPSLVSGANYFWCECLSCGKIEKVASFTISSGKSKKCFSCQVSERLKDPKSKYYYKEIPKSYYIQIKKSALARNHIFSVTLNYLEDLFIKQNRKCAISGMEIGFNTTLIKNKQGQIKARTHTASLDRIDNNKGYIKNNLQWVYKDINYMKQEYSQEHFLHLCKLIAEYNK